MTQAPRDEILDHVRSLTRLAMTLTGDRVRADDLVQETVAKALTHIDRFRPGTDMRAWLLTILRNSHFSERRKAWRDQGGIDPDLMAGLSHPPEHVGLLALTDVAHAYLGLPDAQRRALGLVALQGLSYAEAADLCDCAIGTIKSRVNRARETLCGAIETSRGGGPVLTDRLTLAVTSNSRYRDMV